jgi:hypothetical protein
VVREMWLVNCLLWRRNPCAASALAPSASPWSSHFKELLPLPTQPTHPPTRSPPPQIAIALAPRLSSRNHTHTAFVPRPSTRDTRWITTQKAARSTCASSRYTALFVGILRLCGLVANKSMRRPTISAPTLSSKTLTSRPPTR